MEKKKSQTDPRVIRTRQLIKNAFVELLEEMDLQKITVNRLAERATINRVTFYLHYRDIPDMLEKMADDMIEDISMIVFNELLAHDSSKEGSWRILEHLLEHIAEHKKFYKSMLASRKVPIFRERLSMFMKDVLISRLERSENEPHAITNAVKKDIFVWYESSALIGTIISWLQHDIPYTPSFLAEQFSFLHYRWVHDKD
ncbi:TetR family transcriptional regulator [Bacillus atrophaeus]|uniref:TetR/AcrR family transcriptional regulator n=1 Tax=Bacillus atrophaeus TaxID=1452 RepID=UPI000D0361CD|nr:TetR/AcrR family transcriptional regulator [Bacillus atrophaeus]PRS02592.1 TetR family transcriptional regulator [Bacillus atrophaeus]PSA92958.1 TetR family transcriptional regulator [Bacillus atrophaeus]WNV78479.1 TetR-like C-terminal domain-containing protein [Bacillus atrophaeus]